VVLTLGCKLGLLAELKKKKKKPSKKSGLMGPRRRLGANQALLKDPGGFNAQQG
jgi:hypothetical protein